MIALIFVLTFLSFPSPAISRPPPPDCWIYHRDVPVNICPRQEEEEEVLEMSVQGWWPLVALAGLIVSVGLVWACRNRRTEGKVSTVDKAQGSSESSYSLQPSHAPTAPALPPPTPTSSSKPPSYKPPSFPDEESAVDSLWTAVRISGSPSISNVSLTSSSTTISIRHFVSANLGRRLRLRKSHISPRSPY